MLTYLCNRALTYSSETEIMSRNVSRERTCSISPSCNWILRNATALSLQWNLIAKTKLASKFISDGQCKFQRVFSHNLMRSQPIKWRLKESLNEFLSRIYGINRWNEINLYYYESHIILLNLKYSSASIHRGKPHFV